MLQSVVLPLAVLSVVYLLISSGFVLILHRMGVSDRAAIALGFLAFGLASGLLAAWIWPLDSSMYPNAWALLGGDLLYQWSSRALGDPWLLRVPQVYVLVSVAASGLFGALFQSIYNRWKS